MKWFLTFLVACAVLAAVLHVRQSRRAATDESTSAKNFLPPPSATSAPLAAAPVEKEPEPPPEIAKVPPNTPAPQLNLATLAQNRALWPKQVTLVKPVAFPVVINQRPMGTVTLAPGRSVNLLAISPQGLTLTYQGGTRLVPAEATNVLEMALRLDPPPDSPGTTASRTAVATVGPSTPAARPAAPASVLPPLDPGWALAADRLLALNGPQLLARYLVQKREGYAPAELTEPDWRSVNSWGFELLHPLAGDPPQFYAAASGLLAVAVPLLKSTDPLQRRKGMLIALDVAQTTVTELRDFDLSTVLAELYLFHNVALATPSRGSYRNQSDVADTLPMLISPQDFPRKKRAFEILMKFADNSSIADGARFRLASISYQHGKKADALALLRAVQPSGGMSGVRTLIPQLEKEIKQKKKP